MFELPKSINIGGKQFGIRNDGDYRMVLDCFATLQDIEIPSKEERILTTLVIFYADLNSFDDIAIFPDLEQAVKEMYNFFNAGADEVGAKTNYKLVDWQKDEQMIASAINATAKTEVRAIPYLHWWTFLGYYTAIGECPFSNVINIRYKIKAGKKLEKHEQEFRTNNPNYFIWDSDSLEDKEAQEWVKQLWDDGE